MYSFTYTRAKSLAEARDMLAKDQDAKLLSGGMTLIPTLKQRLASPSQLIDISRIAELRGIAVKGEHLEIGAAMQHAEVARSNDVKQKIPALAYLASQIGDPQVRNRGTIGGSVANNDPVADYPGAALGLGATIKTTQREIAADDFFKGVFETALKADEIVTGISFPVPKRAAYAKFPHPVSGYSMTGSFVADNGNGVRVAITGAGQGVFRWKEAEVALGRNFSLAALKGLAMPSRGLSNDLHATAEYRANLVEVMTRRAVASLTGGK
ncbi:MAG: carbon monoxide dehydrogenase [Betaproteobacteria bacterium RIFCSPLOWO2_02_FULL_62_17]|nr:MAG: carbon monoxide dehydrogenase [Betaproteobacteria bacterium RIFCSPLOWO2_02_FULL_62_17]